MQEAKARRGIQSVELGSKLLVALAEHIRPMALGDLARAADMSPGKAHPYMVSFLKTGFVTQDGASGLYQLGPLALKLGLARLHQLDPIKAASPYIEGLANETGQSVAITIWGNLGPTVVQLIEPVHPMHVNMRAGTVMSLTSTATGHVFAAFLPPLVIKHFLASEANGLGAPPSSRKVPSREFQKQVIETRKKGMARALSSPIPGINALSVPVFDSADQVALVLTVMGSETSFDASWDGNIAQALRSCAAKISYALGNMRTPSIPVL